MMDYNAEMEKAIKLPLRHAIGTPLLSVTYFVLSSDYPQFNTDDPNSSGGCQGIHLVFCGAELEVDWASWYEALRDRYPGGNIASHLLISDHSERIQGTKPFSEEGGTQVPIDATQSIYWRNVVNRPLTQVNVWGEKLENSNYSPQAVSLVFGSAAVVIAVGMTGSEIYLGDGDEMLVFSETEWNSLQKLDVRGEEWLVPFWQYPANHTNNNSQG